MSLREKIQERYFQWLSDIVEKESHSDRVSYKQLLTQLHHTRFRYSISRDQNRAADGINLRYRFANDYYELTGIEDVDMYLKGPCSVLEMMVALAVRCEEFMDDPSIGDRTKQWFWNMISNLGLGGMMDIRYDSALVRDVLDRFLDRDYEYDGSGGLFRVRGSDRDLRTVEIWYQLCWYLDSIT